MKARIGLLGKTACAWTLLVAVGAAEPSVRAVAGPPKADDRASGPLVYWEEVWQTPRPVRLHFLRIDLEDPSVEVAALVSADPDGAGPAAASLQPPRALAAHHNAIAAVNANAFWDLLDATEVEKKRGWVAGKAIRLFGLVISDGVVRNPPQQARTALWIDAAGRAHVGGPGSNDVPRQAVADWEGPLLRSGQTVAVEDNILHPRTLAGTNEKGTRLLLVVADGRMKGYSEGLSLHEAAEVMRAHGCYDAVNLDGGGSSVMLAVTNGPLCLMNRPCGGAYMRPVPVLLGVRARDHGKHGLKGAKR